MASLPDSADALIVGGGPAGTTTATLLKKQDPHRRIVLLDRVLFPRHHVGEALLPDANAVLSKMGVLAKIDGAGFQRKQGATFKWKHDGGIFSEVFTNTISSRLNRQGIEIPTYTWQVPRIFYDDLLLRHAIESGVEVFQETDVERVLVEGGRVAGVTAAREGGERADIAADVVVDCSGLRRIVARALEIPACEHRLGDLAIYRYCRGFKWREDIIGRKELAKVFFAVCATGWVWFIALSDELASYGLVTRREVVKGADADEILDREASSIPEVADMLAGSRTVGAPGTGDGPRTYGDREWCSGYQRTAGPGFYLAGDAAAFVDPLLASGVLIAHRSGMSVANAIHTEWNHPEIDPAEIHAAYTELMRDIWSGFTAMADWWYHQRESGIENWWKTARRLAGDARGAVDLDDLTLFLTFISGYLTDFRLVNIGVGFGTEGLRQVLTGMPEHERGALQIEAEIRDRRVVLSRRFTRAEPISYLATDVDTDRWWRLPAVRFEIDGSVRVFRPPVLPEARTDDDLALILRITQTVLQLSDGKRSVEEVVRETRARVGGNERYAHHMASLVCTDLKRMGILGT